MRPVHTFLMFAFLASVAGFPAEAADSPPAVQAFLANLERNTRIKPVYDELKDDGNGNITLTNLTLAKPASGDMPGVSVKLTDVTFSGITEEAPQLFQVGKAAFNNITLEVQGEGGFTATIPQLGAEGWYIRQLGDNPAAMDQLLATSTFARKITSGKVNIGAAGQALTIDGVESTWDGDPKTGAGTFNVKVSNIAIPEALMALMDQGGMLKQLGYTSLNLDVSTMSDMKVTDEKVSYGFEFGLSGRDIANVKLGASFSDIPLAAYTEILKANSEGKEPDFNALMPQLQEVIVNGASFRFEDASIVNKILPMAAAMNGMDEQTLRASIGPMVQLTLVQLQNEAFAKQAMEAVTSFFAAPKSLTIAAKPATPLKVSEVMTMDPNKPGEAITRFGIAVTAND